MAVSAYSLVEIYDRGWGRPRRATVADIIATWTVNEVNLFSAFMSASEFHRLGLGRGLGKWLKWEHPTCGVWGGVLTQTPADIDRGLIGLTASGFEWMLSGRASPIEYRQTTATAGAQMLRAMNDSLNPEPLPYTSIQADELGGPVAVEWRGDDCLDLARSLAAQSAQEWDVTVDRGGEIAFVWRQRIGEDKRDRVLIAEGVQVAGGLIDDDIEPTVNALVGVANNRDYERSERHYGEHAVSIRQFGRRLFVRRYDQQLQEGTIRPIVLFDLRREAIPPYLPTLVLSADHPVSAEIRQGDTIRFWSATKNARLAFRVISRTVDLTSNTLTLAGEATALDEVIRVSLPITPQHAGTSTGTSAGASLTVSHEVVGGESPILIARVWSVGAVVTGVTHGGVAMTAIGGIDAGGQRRVSLWSRTNPPAGVADVVVSAAGATGLRLAVGNYLRVNLASPYRTMATGSGTSVITASINAVSAPGDLVLDAIALSSDLAGLEAKANQIERFVFLGGGASDKAGAVSPTALGWDWPASRDWAMLAVALKPAVS